MACFAQSVATSGAAASPPPYLSPDTPQGRGPHPAIMVADPTLPTHTIYRPKNLAAQGAEKLPIVLFANGGCANLGNRFRYFLTEIASHGFIAIAIGPIGDEEYEYWAKPGLGTPAAGSPAAALAAAGTLAQSIPANGPAPAHTLPTQLIDALDWALAQNVRQDSPYFGKLDSAQIAVMGQSCGGLQAIDAAHDQRVKTLAVWNSGAFPEDKRALELKANRATKAGLKSLRVPTLYVSGDSTDMAFVNAEDDVARIDGVPLLRAWRAQTGHGGTYREPDGGDFAVVAVGWLRWQLKGDQTAAGLFVGADCGLCRRPEWHLKKKNID